MRSAVMMAPSSHMKVFDRLNALAMIWLVSTNRMLIRMNTKMARSMAI